MNVNWLQKKPKKKWVGYSMNLKSIIQQKEEEKRQISMFYVLDEATLPFGWIDGTSSIFMWMGGV